jgi:hypothetical protein
MVKTMGDFMYYIFERLGRYGIIKKIARMR